MIRRVAGLLALAMAGAPLLAAQSVSPPIAEYRERARSSFLLQNTSIFPMTVVLEVRGFDISELGEVTDVPLDTSRVHVKLSEMSFRVPPRGTHRVFYEARADTLPAWFNILSAITGARTESGLNVRILLPHVVYLNQKQPLQKEQVAVRTFQFDPVAKKVRVQLENLGPHLGRVQQLSVSDGERTSHSTGAFPLLPRQRRWAEASWEAALPPTRLRLRFAHFTIDTALTALSSSLASDSVASLLRP